MRSTGAEIKAAQFETFLIPIEGDPSPDPKDADVIRAFFKRVQAQIGG